MATVIGALVFAEPLAVPFGSLGVALVFLSVVLINLRLPKRNRHEGELGVRSEE